MRMIESLLPFLATPSQNTATLGSRWWCRCQEAVILNDRPLCLGCGGRRPTDGSGNFSCDIPCNTTSAENGAISNRSVDHNVSGKDTYPRNRSDLGCYATSNSRFSSHEPNKSTNNEAWKRSYGRAYQQDDITPTSQGDSSSHNQLNARQVSVSTRSGPCLGYQGYSQGLVVSHPGRGQIHELDAAHGIYELPGDIPGDGRLGSLQSLGRVATPQFLEDLVDDPERQRRDQINRQNAAGKELPDDQRFDGALGQQQDGAPQPDKQPAVSQPQGQGATPHIYGGPESTQMETYYIARQINGHLALPMPVRPPKRRRSGHRSQSPRPQGRDPCSRPQSSPPQLRGPSPRSQSPAPTPQRHHSSHSDIHNTSGQGRRLGHYAIDLDDDYERNRFDDASFDPNEYALPPHFTETSTSIHDDAFPSL